MVSNKYKPEEHAECDNITPEEQAYIEEIFGEAGRELTIIAGELKHANAVYRVSKATLANVKKKYTQIARHSPDIAEEELLATLTEVSCRYFRDKCAVIRARNKQKAVFAKLEREYYNVCRSGRL